MKLTSLAPNSLPFPCKEGVFEVKLIKSVVLTICIYRCEKGLCCSACRNKAISILEDCRKDENDFSKSSLKCVASWELTEVDYKDLVKNNLGRVNEKL